MWPVSACSSYVSLTIIKSRSPEVPIDAQWLTNERCCTGIAQRPIEDLTSSPPRCVIADDLLIHHHPERPAAQDIQQQDYSRPADPFPKPTPGIFLLPFLNFAVHAASFMMLYRSAQLKRGGLSSTSSITRPRA